MAKECGYTRRTVCVSVRCTRDDGGMSCSSFLLVLIVIFVSFCCFPPSSRHSVKKATPNPYNQSASAIGPPTCNKLHRCVPNKKRYPHRFDISQKFRNCNCDKK